MAVIKREAPDQRRHVRCHVPLGVEILGVPYTVKDWSLGGFRVEDFLGGLIPTGSRLFVRFTVAYQALEVTFTTEVEVVRSSEHGRSLGVRFLRLNAREKELLGYAMLGPTGNGARASLVEALARIDIPVTPVSAVPTTREAPAPGRAALALRRLYYSAFYGAAGVALGTVILLALYFHFCRLDLEYSVVTLPLYPVISQDVARCQEVFVKEGDEVQAGQPLLRVEDDLLTRDLEVAEIQRAAAQVDVETAAARVAREEEKLALYRNITTDKVTEAEALVANLTEQWKTAAANLDREHRLLSMRATSQQSLEQAEAREAALQGSLQQAQGELRIARNALRAVGQGSFYDQRRLVGDLPQFLVNLQDARERDRLATERVRLTKARAERLTYSAPFAAKVVRVLKVAGNTMNRGEALMILEKAGEEPVIDGFVTQDDANCLSLGAEASVWVPSLDQTFRAQIVKIDRTSGFLTEMQAHLKDSQLRYNWRGQQDRSAYVQLMPAEDLPAEVRRQLTGGMPVTASVARRPALWDKLCSLFR
jgi:multidrug resistance efflux pump